MTTYIYAVKYLYRPMFQSLSGYKLGLGYLEISRSSKITQENIHDIEHFYEKSGAYASFHIVDCELVQILR